MNKISVATLITDGTKILIGHVTGERDKYDFPKGCIDEGELPVQTAVREVYEETGLKLDIDKFSPSLGVFPYYNGKDLNVFVYYLPNMDSIDIDELGCESTFTDLSTGVELPEIDGYKIVRIDELEKYINKSLFNCFDNYIREKLVDYFLFFDPAEEQA